MFPLMLLLACSGAPESTEAPQLASMPAEAPKLDRERFNQLAAEEGLPVFQKQDGTVVLFRSSLPEVTVEEARERIAKAHDMRQRARPDARTAALWRELGAGRVTLLETDLTSLPEDERAMVGHLLEAARLVEALHAAQRIGTPDVTPTEGAGQSVMFRNQGPWCEVDTDPACSATAEPVSRKVGIYPLEAQTEGFCDGLDAALLDPFHAVVQGESGLEAVPYPERWPELHAEAAAALEAAAEAAPEGEQALATYLRAAAKAFSDNHWFAADAAWAAMSQDNSGWYVRVGPDEVYWDPCAAHAGYHMTLARIDPAGLEAQQLLEPHKQALEHALAEKAGAPYAERTVGFDLPEFIQVVLNAGDDRSPRGATVGQSLPNWGPVAEAGGRTVAMTNIGVDPDGVRSRRSALSSVFCPATMALWPEAPDAQLMSTVLHEAAHNLGPAHDYAVDGKDDVAAFGGTTASILEELKAQTAALYLTDTLGAQGVLDASEVPASHVADIAWAFGHIGRGLLDNDGNPKTYSQLAAVQVGFFADQGAMAWHADETAANGEDQGCWSIDTAALSAAIDALNTRVLGIKARGDKAAAQELLAPYTDPADARWTLVQERFGREPLASYVYRIER